MFIMPLTTPVWLPPISTQTAQPGATASAANNAASASNHAAAIGLGVRTAAMTIFKVFACGRVDAPYSAALCLICLRR